MNGKKARRLRNEARELTIGLPNVEYIFGEPPLYKEIKNPVTGIVDLVKVQKGVPTVLAECTRKTYQALKSAA